MPGQTIDLGEMPMPISAVSSPIERRRSWLPVIALAGAVAVLLTGTVSVPRPIDGTVVRATGVDYCHGDGYAGVAVTVVNQEPAPVTLTSVRARFDTASMTASVAVRPGGAPDPCRPGRRGLPLTVPPDGLGLVMISYPIACDGAARSLVGLDLSMSDGRRSVGRDVIAGTALVLPGASQCGLGPNPPAGTGG